MCYVCLQTYRMESTADVDDLFEHELRPPRMITCSSSAQTPSKKSLHVELAKEIESKTSCCIEKSFI